MWEKMYRPVTVAVVPLLDLILYLLSGSVPSPLRWSAILAGTALVVCIMIFGFWIDMRITKSIQFATGPQTKLSE